MAVDEHKCSMAVDELAAAWLRAEAEHNMQSETPAHALGLTVSAEVSRKQFATMLDYLGALVLQDNTVRLQREYRTQPTPAAAAE